MRFPHWQFFESLDDELHSLSRIVEFSKDNFPTHSVHFARLYLSVCSEIDVVAKLLCARIDSSKTADNIHAYRTIIAPKFPNFSKLQIEMPGHELDFQPWAAWGSNEIPQWWTSHNQVKHERNKFFRDANLGNLLESSAGLLVLLVYQHQPELYNPCGSIQPDFKTMRIEKKYASGLRWGFDYELPDFGKSTPDLNSP
jgi:hypothetical protein